MIFTSINPATEETLEEYPATSDGEVDQILTDAADAQEEWRRTDFAHRADLMRQAGEILQDRSRELGELMTREMGKPIGDAVSEAEKCAWVCDYYAEGAADFLAPEEVDTDASRSLVTYQPLGTILAIMPWNFPFWQVFRFAAPNLMAGNAGLLKHAPNVPGCALAIEDVFHEAGFPPELFRTLLIDEATAGDVIDDDRVRGVTLTGSVGAGRAVASRAGERIKKTVLELGGSDPYLVLEDADLDAAAKTCVTSRLINSGQSCIAAKRFIVVEEVADEFTRKVVERMEEAVMGDPMDEATEVGPQARDDLRDELHDQVERSVAGGAEILLGGRIPEGRGYFYPPTVLTKIRPGTPAWEEELFGPVASVITVSDEAEGIRVANHPPYGLGAAVFTSDVERGERIARDELEAGCCFVNDFVRSDPRLPFGGIKDSGYGRELAPHGIREFVNVKTVWVS
ncbi:MAG: NAD-dependent succinate-semialdehyde dehydrogenase [Longimicrobiales bacterium]|nr:NAD-dependent succinate-semialdehyde dehydrogenase [Longimicrobiales bacterium]